MVRRNLLAAVFLGIMQVSLAQAQTCPSAIAKTTPTSDFTVHNNGTVTHIPTGLMWKVCSEGQAWQNDGTCSGTASGHNWKAALEIPQTLKSGAGYAGHTDWRLPNVKELASIAELACYSPAINTAVFHNTPPFFYWSASPYADGSPFAWVVRFYHGNDGHNLRYNDYGLVRLVRSGQ
ncbi:Lcl C-terminal domain-containing protein [Thiomicrospira microaerophila]|uniref:Lcl C-terminal domain-containing protein n=1 Tax=Thiomicrospira microaerophila TaxID=406020 RepID=UPI0005CAFAE1|nr:DUF1566 domain-containing protein [Thiomicrospira microaerophila]